MNNKSQLKVCFFGNQDNCGYRWCKWLRLKGMDAHLYMMENDNSRSFPENMDRGLTKDSYPEWIHMYHNSVLRTLFIDVVVKKHIEESFDVIVISGAMSMMIGYHFDIPIINISTGPSNQGVIKIWDHLSFFHKVKCGVSRFLIRRTVGKCKKILVHYDPELYSLVKINQDGKSVLFGHPEDVKGSQKLVDEGMRGELNVKYSGYEKVFLWLGRICFSDPLSPMYKGTDKFLEAAELLIKEGRKIRLVIGDHGEDACLLKSLVVEKGMSEHVEWVPHMEYWKLLTFMSISNAVIVDELTKFNCVSSGMFRESLSVGSVLIRSYCSVLTSAGHGPDCPILHAVSSDDVYNQMVVLLDWSESRWREQQESAKHWAEKYLDQEHQIERLISILEEVVYVNEVGKRLEKIYSDS